MAKKASTKKESVPTAFSGFKGSARKQDAKMRPGKYVVMLDGAEHVPKTRNGAFIKVDMIVLGCIEPWATPEDVHPEFQADRPNKAGDKVAVKYWERSEGWEDKLCTLLAAAFDDDEDFDADDVGEDDVMAVIGEEQSLSGRVVVMTMEHRFRKAEYDGEDLPRIDDPESPSHGMIDFKKVKGYTTPYFWNSVGSPDDLQGLISEEEYAAVSHLFESDEDDA